MSAVFPFPGGKSRHASWILEQMPEHTCFATVFGGAAGVLVNKSPSVSDVEIYNDLDGDLVQFFEVLRDRREELAEWLRSVPYSRELHADWAHKFYNGYRSADDVERAGQFFYLRYAQWGGIYGKNAGFGTSKQNNQAGAFANKIEKLERFAERFEQVTIENLSWHELVEKYDGEETLFYCDPPYVGKEDYYLTGTIDHESLVSKLKDLEGYCICSYSELPKNADGLYALEKDSVYMINSGKTGSANETTERLLLNFDPEEVPEP